MKKILLITAASVTLFVSSCQKENITPTSVNDMDNIISHNFKHIKEVKVYDKTNEYFVKVELQSDSEEMINKSYEYYNSQQLEFLYDKPEQIVINNVSKALIPNSVNTQRNNQNLLSVITKYF